MAVTGSGNSSDFVWNDAGPVALRSSSQVWPYKLSKILARRQVGCHAAAAQPTFGS